MIEDIRKVDRSLLPDNGNKIGSIKKFHSLAPQAQVSGYAIGKLQGHVNAGYYSQIKEASLEFNHLAKEILKRMKIAL